jgi:Ca2+-binding EF-hand superfamily protein
MKALAVGLLVLGSALVCRASQGPSAPPSEAVDLILPGEGGRVRIQLTLAGKALAAPWEAFLDRWFEYFDRAGNGWLSRAEAGRILALPAADGRNLAFDFTRCDTNKDGRVTRGELKEYYRRGGFTPVRLVVEQPALRDLVVSAALFRHLGPDADGKLTEATVKRAEALLRKLDEDEDESITPAEVLSLGGDTALTAPRPSAFEWSASTHLNPLATIQLAVDVSGRLRLGFEQGGTPTLRVIPGDGEGLSRMLCGNAVLDFQLGRKSAATAAMQARKFIVAQFKTIVGRNGFVEKSQVADDPSLQVLADLFAFADRNGDGKLTLAELDQFLALLQQGTECFFVITLADCGRNLFSHLDTNGDGRLDAKELRAAAQVLTKVVGAREWRRNELPYFARVTFQTGHRGNAFGPLPLVLPSPAATSRQRGPMGKGPAWFQAMDSNGDGYLSRTEFLGPAELFRQLDCDGDGLISAAEAQQATTKGRAPTR